MAPVIPLLAGASTLTKVGLALSAVSAVMTIKQGLDTKAGYKAQARTAELDGRKNAVKERERGVQVLINTNRALASVGAIASAGGLEPTIGTPLDIGTFDILNPGVNDFITSKANESNAIASATAKARDLRYAGKQAMTGALISAGTTLASASMTAGGIGSSPGLMKTGYTDIYGLGVA